MPLFISDRIILVMLLDRDELEDFKSLISLGNFKKSECKLVLISTRSLVSDELAAFRAVASVNRI